MTLRPLSFGKEFRLLNAADFSYLKSDSHAFKSRTCLVFYKPSRLSLPHFRVGFAVTGKVAKAHRRNRIKRKLREFFRASDLKPYPFDMTVVVSRQLDRSGLSEEQSEQALLKDLEKFVLYFKKRI